MSSFLVLQIYILLSFWLTISTSACITSNGCSTSSSCVVEFIENKIYGCDGVWYREGLQNAEYLCGNEYHICSSYTEAQNLGLTKDICTSTSLIPTNYFYATHQSSSGSLYCDDIGTDDIFGCASGTDGNWLFFGDSNNQVNCGPLAAALSTDSAGSGKGWIYGWEPWGEQSDQHELLHLEHRHTKTNVEGEHWEYTNNTVGGVLCCMNNVIETTLYTTTDVPIITECSGCDDSATCDVEFVLDAIYGCGGIWEEAGIENAEQLCGEGYEICHDGDIAEQMGLTKDDCYNKPKENHFYASSARSYGWGECELYNIENVSKSLGYDNVFGCGNSNEGWIKTQWVNCGSFGSQIEWDAISNEYKYGWQIRDIDDLNELKAVRHLNNMNSDQIFGGALCCKSNTIANMSNDNDNEWDIWHINKNDDSHSCKVSTGCTQTNGLVTCDIEFIPNRVYGCGGKFEDTGISNGDWICRNGYSICSTTDIVESYGLTKEMCASYPKNNHFYASYSSTLNGYTCIDDYGALNGVFGCGLDIKSNWLWTISEWIENKIPVSCGPYTAALNQYNYNTKYGWNTVIENWARDKYKIQHLSWDYGGVMCCRNLGEATYESEYYEKLTAFYSARISEIISLIITILIIIISLYQSRKRSKTHPIKRKGKKK
eukprot:97733_1